MAIYKILQLGLWKYKGPFDSDVNGPCGEQWPNVGEMLNELARSGWMVEEYVYGSHKDLEPSARELIGVVLVNKESTETQENQRIIAKYTDRLENLRNKTQKLSPDNHEVSIIESGIRFYEEELNRLSLSQEKLQSLS